MKIVKKVIVRRRAEFSAVAAHQTVFTCGASDLRTVLLAASCSEHLDAVPTLRAFLFVGAWYTQNNHGRMMMINTHKRLLTGLAHFLQGSAKMLVAELPRCWWQSCLDVDGRKEGSSKSVTFIC